MVWSPPHHWNPTKLISVADSATTSTGVTEVMTDAGRAYIKTLGNRQGPHVLATDWVGTLLASWFGLSTFEIAILNLGLDDRFPLPQGYEAQPGPAFATRAMAGEPWGRSGMQLDSLVNPNDITRLVVFDTWTLNCDRHFHDPVIRKPNIDNVFLSSEGLLAPKRRLIAMDHGLCFIRSGDELTVKLAKIDKIKDENVYGLFPEFRKWLRADIISESVQRLRTMDSQIAEAILATIPEEWEVSDKARQAWRDLIYRRASFVADNFELWIEKAAPSFGYQGE